MKKRNIQSFAAQTSEKYFRELLGNIKLVAVILDVNGKVTYCNPYLLSLSGYTIEEMTGSDWFKIMIPGSDLKTKLEFLNGLKSGSIIDHFENPIATKNGEIRYIIWNNTTLKNDSGSVIGTASIGEDITERKQSEKARQESEMLYHALVDQASDALFVHDFEGKFVEVNQRACESLGYSKEELLRKSVTDVEQDFNLRNAQAEWTKIKPGTPFTLYGHQKRKDGTTFPVEVRFGCSVWKGQKLFLGLVRDISERKIMEKSLRESEEKFRNVFEHSVIGNSITYLNGKLQTNNAFRQILGYTEYELSQLNRQEITHPDDIENDEKKLDTIISGEVITARWEKRYIHKNGHTVWVDISTTLQRDNEGNPLYFITAVNDISERKRTEDALRESESKFRKIYEEGPFGMVLVNKEFRFISANTTFCRIVGYNEHEILNCTFNDITHAEDINIDITNIRKLIDGEIPIYKTEKRYIRKDGLVIWGSLTVTANYSPDGKFLYNLAIIEDITGRKQAEDALRESEERLNLILENNPIAIWDWNIKTDKWYATKKYYTMLGYEPETGYTDRAIWLNRIHPDDRESVSIKIANVLKHADDHYSYDARMLHADGSYRWQTVIGQVIERDETGKAVRMLGVRIDINERKQAEEEILKLNETLENRVAIRTTQLEASNKEMEAFSYSVSHDLRAPLRHINGFTDVLTKEYYDQLPENAKNYLNTIKGSAIKMGALIDDLLSFSRTGRADLKKSSIKMNQVVEDALAQISTPINDRKIEWNISSLPEVYADYNLLRLVWINLLDNAIKYTRPMKRAVIKVGYKEEKKEFIFYIQDNGVGFDMKYAQKLFGVFQRLHSPSQFEGTGIGLANVQRIILRHGGRTWAEAETDKGATFYFSIPKEEEDKP
jgi:PAS domain S-box-containing protein